MHRPLVIASLVAALVLPTRAQTALLSLNGTPQQNYFGGALAAPGDVDGDGLPDLVIAASGGGGVDIVSGASGAVLQHIAGFYGFGADVAAGDLDGDGAPDVVASDVVYPDFGINKGRVTAYSGATGALLHEWIGAANKSFLGRTLAVVGDVNADGRADVAMSEDKTGGQVRLCSGLDGSQLQAWPGVRTAATGDVDGDGVPDVLAMNHGAASNGAVSAWSGANGSLLFTQNGVAAGSKFFGTSAAGLGDVDLDGAVDVLVTGSQKAVILSGAGGAVLRSLAYEPQYGLLGGSSAAAGDVDGDGVPDAAVAGESLARIYSGANASPIASYYRVYKLLDFGWDIVSPGDVDGDGTPDLAVGMPGDLDDFSHAGAVRIWSGKSGWTGLTGSQLEGVGDYAMPLSGHGALVAGSNFQLRMLMTSMGKPLYLVFGTSQVALPFKGGILHPDPQYVATFLSMINQLVVDGAWPPGLPSGTTLVFQAWQRYEWGDGDLVLRASNGLRAITP